MARVYNFSAGPSMLPESILNRAAAEMLDYNGSGQSVMEMSHRSKVYEEIIFGARDLFRKVLNVPENYEILFFQGGASLQFAGIPMNLLNGSGKADYVLTGQFATKAYQEAQKYGEIKVVASSKDKTFSYIPELDKNEFTPDADYFYICLNNTIYGTVWHDLPETGDVPLVADVSSCFLSEPMDVSKFGLIYGGAQKNVAPAGLTVVIVRKDLIGNALPFTPTVMDYKVMAENDSMYNTPPCYSIYMCKLMLEWIESIGGLEEVQARNLKKSAILYDFLDSSKMFSNPVVKKDRSMMNVTFVAPTDELNAKFVKEATVAGFVNLKGHRSVGGMRASIYNAMPIEGVEKLVDFMKTFESRN
ncbi:MAG TPA: 3-phosphoserine/phosphohydroxythreonine transaminase [Clostridiales bacterium]|jgi:phosphoserine aminotransferase|nr:3-phosphoserine/phosphohydroxythreonine transaminase [Clostridiales bacterium]HRT82329.1 3-phosphoserine/phosphohydroxythreonine transaminase [Oscillospiraceae bacterium]